jgi:hypothetical protein
MRGGGGEGSNKGPTAKNKLKMPKLKNGYAVRL